MAANQSLEYFFEACEEELGFLEFEHGFFALGGLTRYLHGRHIIMPDYDVQSVDYPFYATMRYERNDVFVELSYGDYNFMLDCHVTLKRRYRFLLSDLVSLIEPVPKGAPIHFTNDRSPGTAPQPHHILSRLQTYRRILDVYIAPLMDLPEEILSKALDIQQQKLQSQIEDQHISNKNYACEKAAAAFRDCDYRKAIMLYRPYKDDLEPQEYRMFSLAILYLDQ